jgi:stage II sporulation protein GA (sporulation sigma-E factor processing peptidase)
MRIIPCRVLGQNSQFIIAIKADSITVQKEYDLWETEKGLISFTMQQLSADDSFQCIIHPKLLSGPKTETASTHVS